jgi:hypothetical protein
VATLTRRHYIDNAPTTTLSGSINASTTTVVVASLSGYPTSFPFPATMGMGTTSAEQITVISTVGTTLTVTRNANGQGAFSHPAGEIFNHTANAVEYDEANAHVNASTGVHGITGAVVGTTDTQTLSNKTFANTTFNAVGGVPGINFTVGAGTDNPWVSRNAANAVVAKVDGLGTITGVTLAATAGITAATTITATGTITGGAVTTAGTVTGGSVVSSADLTGSTGRLTAVAAVTLAGTTHALQIGATASSNLAFDTGRVQARNNGVVAALGINNLGGAVAIGAAGSAVTMPGTLAVTGSLDTARTRLSGASVGAAASGFTENGTAGDTMLNGRLVNVQIAVTNTADIIPNGVGNVSPDVVAFTCVSGFRPDRTVSGVCSNGGAAGECIMDTSGVCSIRTGNATYGAGGTILLTYWFFRP